MSGINPRSFIGPASTSSAFSSTASSSSQRSTSPSSEVAARTLKDQFENSGGQSESLTGRISSSPPAKSFETEHALNNDWESLTAQGKTPIFCIQIMEGTYVPFILPYDVFEAMAQSSPEGTKFIADPNEIAKLIPKTGISLNELNPAISAPLLGKIATVDQLYLDEQLLFTAETKSALVQRNQKPIVYLRIGRDGKPIIQCISKEGLLAKYNITEKDIQKGSFSTEDSRSRTKTTYITDPLEIFKHIDKSKLTKVEVRVYRYLLLDEMHQNLNAELAIAGKLNVRGVNFKKCQEIIDRYKPAIEFLQEDEKLVDAIYPNGVIGENICDFLYLNPSIQLGMIFDAPGHGDTEVVKGHHPIYREISTELEDEIQNFDFSQPDAIEAFQRHMANVYASYPGKFKALFESYVTERTANEEKLSEINALIPKSCGSRENAEAFPLEKFEELRSLINLEKLDNTVVFMKQFFESYQNDRNFDKELESTKIEIMESLQKGNFIGFKAAIAKFPSKNFPSLSNELKSKNPKPAGAAALFAKIIPISEGEFLYTAQWADCCYLVLSADDSYECIRENGLSDQGLGLSNERGVVIQRVRPLKQGDVVFAFSDGIGEFLTEKELVDIVKNNYLSGIDAIHREIRKELEQHKKLNPEDRFSEDGRIRISHARREAKKWDPSGADEQCVDDISCFLLSAEEDPLALRKRAVLVSEKTRPQAEPLRPVISSG